MGKSDGNENFSINKFWSKNKSNWIFN